MGGGATLQGGTGIGQPHVERNSLKLFLCPLFCDERGEGREARALAKHPLGGGRGLRRGPEQSIEELCVPYVEGQRKGGVNRSKVDLDRVKLGPLLFLFLLLFLGGELQNDVCVCRVFLQPLRSSRKSVGLETIPIPTIVWHAIPGPKFPELPLVEVHNTKNVVLMLTQSPKKRCSEHIFPHVLFFFVCGLSAVGIEITQVIIAVWFKV